MSFDFSTLVTDRTQADVNRVKQIAEKIKNGTASESELAEFNSAAMKGAYNHTDLNRVTAAMDALKAKLEGYGYNVPGYRYTEPFSEYGWPTPETMTVYLLNVSAIRAVLAVMKSTPSVPVDMERLLLQEANNIEIILSDVLQQLTIMPTTFIPAGEALSGGDNL